MSYYNNITFNLVILIGICAFIYMLYLLSIYPNKYGFDRIAIYSGLIFCLMLVGNKNNSSTRSIVLSSLILISVTFFSSAN